MGLKYKNFVNRYPLNEINLSVPKKHQDNIQYFFTSGKIKKMNNYVHKL